MLKEFYPVYKAEWGRNKSIAMINTKFNTQYLIITYNEKEYEKIYISVTESLGCTLETNTTL